MVGKGLQVVCLEAETTETFGLTEVYTENTELTRFNINSL
jgi:hypothetical protein